jgi:uncharacterized protein YdiU (UPF0061 family)
MALGVGVRFGFENTYARLPERFFARVKPTPVGAPKLVKVNRGLAVLLGLDAEELASPRGVEVLAGNRIVEDSEPLAMAYAGHQFGHFVPQLGDGRANLLGEIVARDGVRYDVQLKGAGRTPFSRGGDGRAALGPVLREYVVSEAMAALGVPTTRALAAVTTGEGVVRERVLPGAVLTRVAASHLRVGTFQFFAARGDLDGVRTLADYALARHYPEVLAGGGAIHRGLLEGVARRQGALVAQWMLLGFVHGVMNTDNTSISGETIDFGPCAFLEEYDPETVFSSIDRMGRYAYGNQPHAAHWNVTRLAEALLPLLAEEAGGDQAGLDAAHAAIAVFGEAYDAARLAGLRRKLGLATEREGDLALAEDLLERMAANGADFTLTFRRLCGEAGARDLFRDPAAFDAWANAWRTRLAAEGATVEDRAEAMRRVNPAYIPRNHVVEAMIESAVERGDFAPFEEWLQVVANPYEERAGWERYAEPAKPEQRVTATFCGT